MGRWGLFILEVYEIGDAYFNNRGGIGSFRPPWFFHRRCGQAAGKKEAGPDFFFVNFICLKNRIPVIVIKEEWGFQWDGGFVVALLVSRGLGLVFNFKNIWRWRTHREIFFGITKPTSINSEASNGINICTLVCSFFILFILRLH